MGLVTMISDVISVGEPAVKILLTIYSGYIVALIHRTFFYTKHSSVQYLYFTTTSLGFLYWNFGWDAYHSFLCIFVQWLIHCIFQGSILAVMVSFIFQMGYLTWGYVCYSTSDYDINWCIPHCILTLRMIGLSFDIYDGHRNEADLSPDQKERGIKDIPSLLEILGFSYLYCGYLIGPQYSLQRVRSLLSGGLTDSPGNIPDSIFPGFRRGFSGTILLGVQAYLDATFYPQYYLTEEFKSSGFLYKAGYVSITGHCTLLRYIALWMINEGVCIVCGLGYRRDEKTGKVKWDAVRNVSLHNFLFAGSFQDIITSFNINTNGWVMRYVFKRLRFVGIRTVSHLCSLIFLALWHGLHEGYFTCFAYEFLTISVEKPLIVLLNDWWLVKKIRANPTLKWIPHVVGFIYLHSLLGYCVLDFTLLKWRLYQPVYASIYYHGHLFFGTLLILLKLRPFLASEKKVTEKLTQDQKKKN